MSLTVMRWPYPCRWAFSLIDDTDCSTLEAVRTVYEYCLARGIHPTKTLWVHAARRECGSPHGGKPDPGVTLDDAGYLAYCQSLANRGVELCLHDASAGNNLRPEIEAAFERFHEAFGYLPRVHVFHSHNADHFYWGADHYRSRWLGAIARAVAGRYEYHGSDPGSPWYWSDICRRLISYVRLYRTRRFDVLRCNPSMPYHLPGKPDVRLWFSASAGAARLDRFDERAIEEIARNDGAFLLYAYSATLVTPNDSSVLRPEVQAAFDLIGSRADCWRPTVSALLDRCLATKNIIVTRRRNAYVIANPTGLAVPDLQLRSTLPALYLPSGGVLHPDAEGRYRLAALGPGECVTLYLSAEAAESGDPGGIGHGETLRMMFEEMRHLVSKRLHRERRRMRRRLRNLRS
jgi:hypothetical protein